MKLVSEYLERCAHFERLAQTETDPKLQEQLMEQAEAYYKLAANCAQQLNQPMPSRRSPPPDTEA